MEQIIVNPKDYGLEEKNVKSIEEAFKPKIIERDGLEKVYGGLIKQEITQDICNQAGSLRKKLVKVRTGISDIHKTQKAYFLSAGRFVDAWKNKETLPITQMEENLGKMEKHFEIKEQERLQKIQDIRLNRLSKYVEDVSDRYLADMEEDVWEAYISSKKKDYELLEAAKRQAEIERIAKEKEEIAERKRIRDENELLRKQAEEREKEAKILADKEAKERELDHKQHEAELSKEREKSAKIELEERTKREKVEKELREKREAEEKRQRDEELRVQNELNKGDKDKVSDLKEDLKRLKSKYTFTSNENKKMYSDVGLLIDKVLNHIKL